ncbi:endonuclease III [Clostridium homopropionicum DSM 5847]|uniref:Endonuclease III n=1 Tax=Clostridium homopropionicum DSM 5847 TaxID=1121318 RepID=A0A0L6ZCT8_9CLOT|nr:endonuclease III [Clostridium homopropionicum]KOA20757.1 endonuclease III [Clostridium homopropionicum DSM 5847]SFF89809.1 DNA-(apurinic or apyrimidinic site) lyase /endonuclease III [Clostridium homopropionicum]
MKKELKKRVIEILENTYKGAKCGLDFNSPYELLVSTILSAQCTDERVNEVTKELYKKYNTPEAMVTLTEQKLGEIIKSCGLYKNKSRNILAASKSILNEHNGKVPENMEELIKLPGVGRKTANVVLSNAFGVPAIAVDTHVFRVANRIGIGTGKNVDQVEKELMKNIPMEKWSDAHHYIIWHGRKICKARNPQCSVCPLSECCEYYSKNKPSQK